jgi:hypothetical protein
MTCMIQTMITELYSHFSNLHMKEFCIEDAVGGFMASMAAHGDTIPESAGNSL